MKHSIHILISAVGMAIIAYSCSDKGQPDFLEPVISNIGATDISRSGATFTATVENRRNGSFESLRFIYTDSDGNTLHTEEIPSPSGETTTSVTGLTAGTEYTLQAVGRRKTTTVKSDEITFTTLPNDLPTVGTPTMVSSSSTAIIAKFAVVSDGGTPITDAGCYIYMTSGLQCGKISATTSSQTDCDELYVTVTSLEQATEYILTPYAANKEGEAKGEPMAFTTSSTVALGRPGDLKALVSTADYPDGHLSISGPMDGGDFRHLRRLLGAENINSLTGNELTDIDLTDITITEGGASYDGSRFTVADMVTTSLFADCATLSSIKLPLGAHTIQRDAFPDCPRLKYIGIAANVVSLGTSARCEALETIHVSEANPHFKESDGVLFNHELSEIVWFPQGRQGEYSLPATVIKIRRNAFAGTKIQKLILPPDLTEIERAAFAGSSLREIILPERLTTIHEGIFQNCPSLQAVQFGPATEFVGDYILDGCSPSNIRILATFPPFTSDNAFNDTRIFESCRLEVPSGCKHLYRNHRMWGKFTTISEIE